MTRRTHVIVWGIAGTAILSALGVALLRSVLAAESPLLAPPAALVQDALNALAVDQLALEPETQAVVRAAAVVVEQGLVQGPEANFVLAIQYQREMNVQGAEALFRQAIAQAPEWSWPPAGLGTLLSRSSYGREEEAIEALRKAIELEPGWAKPHNSLAVLLRAQGELDEAEQEARLALALDPEDVSVQNNFANLMVANGRFQEAEEHYLNAIELQPDHPKPYYNLACLYSLMGQAQKGLDYLEEAIQRAPALRAEAAIDPDLQNLSHLPRFQRLVYD